MYENMKDHIFDKSVVCPVCDNHFKTKAVKTKSPRIQSKDSDFFIRYTVANPYFYDVWICNSCGYAAMKSDFENLRSYRQELVRSNVTPKWKPREYPTILDENIAIERYKLALLNAVLIKMPSSTKAMISLKISWMYRMLDDSEHEKVFLGQALEGLNDAYISEPFPIYGLQRDSLMYLIGDLNRRVGNDDEALRWYSRTIISTNATYRVKELARNGKELIKSKNN